MNSCPTIKDPTSYDEVTNYNDKQAANLFAIIFPDIPEPMIYHVAKIVSYLSETQVNPDLLPRVIRGVHNILIGTGKGQVIVHVSKSTTNVSVRETDEEIKSRM
jgi:hypothetical protein